MKTIVYLKAAIYCAFIAAVTPISSLLADDVQCHTLLISRIQQRFCIDPILPANWISKRPEGEICDASWAKEFDLQIWGAPEDITAFEQQRSRSGPIIIAHFDPNIIQSSAENVFQDPEKLVEEVCQRGGKLSYRKFQWGTLPVFITVTQEHKKSYHSAYIGLNHQLRLVVSLQFVTTDIGYPSDKELAIWNHFLNSTQLKQREETPPN
jgi:hypothetical protein